MNRLGIAIAAMLLLFVLPLWSQQSAAAPDFVEALQERLTNEGWSREEIQELIGQEVDWSQAGFRDAAMVATCLVYAEGEEQIGPYGQAQLAAAVMSMAREMRALGFGEPQIIRTALNGTREALAELSKLRDRERSQEDSDTGAGELIRNLIRQELQTAMHLQARHKVRSRVQEEKHSRPADLLVPPGPQGPGGPGRWAPGR